MNNRKYSLYFLLGIVIILTVVSIMAVHATYVYHATKNKILKEIDENSRLNIIALNKNIVNLMAAYSANEYDRVVMSEMERYDNFAIIVEDYKMGSILGMPSYVSGKIRDDQRNIVDYDPKNSEHNERLSECLHSIKHDIKGANGEKLGVLRLYNSDYRVNEQLNRIIVENTINTAVISLMLILALFALIRLVVLRPLAEMMESITKTGEDGLPLEAVSKEGASEIFLLADTINRMIGVARRSNEALNEQQRETNELKERLEYAINGAQDGLWDWNLQTNEVYFSPRFKEMYGYRDDEFQNVLESWSNNVHPDDMEKIKEAVAFSQEVQGRLYENTHRVRHKNGSWVWVLARAQNIFNAEGKAIRMVGFHTDITKQKKLEEELRESNVQLIALKERLEYAVNGTRDGLWDWDLKSNEIYFSSRWKEMLGYRDDELPNVLETWEKLIYPDDLEKTEKAIAFSQEIPGRFYEKSYRIQHKSGNWLWILDRGQTIFDDEGKAVRMVGFHTDITKQKELEQELIEQENLMLSQSRHVAMGEMIGMIAHQWRQPITVIAMGANNVLADIALEDVSIERFKQEAQVILKQTEYLSKTIDDFRNFFRPNQEKDKVQVQEVLLEAKQIMGKSLEYHNIELSIASDEDEAIYTYSRELLQVVLNLLKNSKEALEAGKVEDAYIHASVESLADSIVIRVCDNGGGIEASIMNRIFEPYFSTKDKKTGTGLGLYMSKTIIEKHLNGTIAAANTDDGVCFIITISKESKTKGEDV